MYKKDSIKKNLEPGKLYRRSDIELFSTSVDRHLIQLVNDGTLKKVGPGLYLRPEISKWGEQPASDRILLKAFLKDDSYLMFSFNSYNSLGLGTTQLYNHTVVYNHKRHGKFKLGNRVYDFRIKPKFPNEFNRENLLVDMLNNLDELVENREKILAKLRNKLSTFQRSNLEQSVKLYGKIQTKKLFKNLFNGKKISTSR